MDFFTDLASLQRAGLLVGPLAAAAFLFWVHRPTPRQATAAMVALLWNLPALLLLQVVVDGLGLWHFSADRSVLLKLPIDVWIGWAVWWGPVAVFTAQRFGAARTALGMVLLDLAGMPLLSPLLTLNPTWLWGELLAVMLVLAPTLAFAALTERDRHPILRTTFHAFGWGGYVLLLLPAAAFSYEALPLAPQMALSAAIAAHGWPLSLCLLAVIALCLLVGAMAALEFAVAGDGTPIPYDPPKRVVISGPYAYLANPMQVTVALMMFAMGWLFGSVGLLAIGATFVIFDAIFAAGYNRLHIARAFPQTWDSYLAEVPEWRLHSHPTRLLRGRLELPGKYLRWQTRLKANSHGLEVYAGSKLRYHSSSLPGPVFGGLALLRALEHVNLGWALLAWNLRGPLEIMAAINQWQMAQRKSCCCLRVGI